MIDSESKLVADFRTLVRSADLDELRVRPADLKLKSAGRGPVSIQGMILDAMDEERITRAEASRLLDEVNRRLRPDGAGLSVVTESGELVALVQKSTEDI